MWKAFSLTSIDKNTRESSKFSKELANAYDRICVENLNMKAMFKDLKFGKSVCDNGCGNVYYIYKNKLEDMGKRLLKVDRFFASFRICLECVCKNSEVSNIAVKAWIYTDCGKFKIGILRQQQI